MITRVLLSLLLISASMVSANMNSANLVTASPIHAANCELSQPPADAGVTQAHGVLLYLYPRSHTITGDYDGCQTQWFMDEDVYRRLNVTLYKGGNIAAYNNINIDGAIAFHCDYNEQKENADNDKRCPALSRLKPKSYQADCFNRASVDNSGSYEVDPGVCQLR